MFEVELLIHPKNKGPKLNIKLVPRVGEIIQYLTHGYKVIAIIHDWDTDTIKVAVGQFGTPAMKKEESDIEKDKLGFKNN